MKSDSSQGAARDARALLRRAEIFARLNGRQIERLARLATYQQFAAGARILRRGDTGIALYVIVRGRVAVTQPCEASGEELYLAELMPGQVFGEISLIDGGPRSATVTAIEPTECLVLTCWDFGGNLSRDPEMARALLPMLCARIRSLQSRLLPYEPAAAAD